MAPTRSERAVGVVALLLYLAVGVVPYLGSGLVAPIGGAVALWAAWLIGLVACIQLVRRQPVLAMGAPPVALLFWVAFVQAGSLLFGWTA